VIRVVYEWHVRRESVSVFCREWQSATTAIRDGAAGARGSLLLHDAVQPERILTIARWESLEHWRAFWRSDSHSRMLRMNELAHRLSVTAYDEIADHTNPR
jgi:heme-degrading monooxygenase HmoA